GGEVLNNRTDWSDPTLGSASQSQTNTPVGVAISYGAKLEGGMAWGIGAGFGTPAGGSLDWPRNWPGQFSIQSVKQQVFAFGGGVAFQLVPGLRFGATFVRFQATEELHQKLNFFNGQIADAGLAMSGGANSFGVAAEIKLEGDVHFTDVPMAFQSLLHDQGVTEKLVIPNVLTIGAAYEVKPGFKLMANYEFERWSIYKSDEFIGSSGDFSVTVRRDYNNAHVVRAAGEYAKLSFMPELTLRAGVLRSISDQPTETISPSLTDASSWAVSVGAGYNVSRNMRIDVGYQHAFFD